jgi:hypothetical protein
LIVIKANVVLVQNVIVALKFVSVSTTFKSSTFFIYNWNVSLTLSALAIAAFTVYVTVLESVVFISSSKTNVNVFPFTVAFDETFSPSL